MRIIISLAGVAALTLGACSPAGDKAAEERADASGARAPAPGKMDAPRPGMWRVTTSMAGMPEGMAMPSVETCVKQASFEEMQRGGAQLPEGVDCSAPSFRRDGNAMVGHSVCTMPDGVRTESDTRVTGDFNSRYTMEVKTRTTPAPTPAMAETTMTMTAERIGDC